MRYAVLQMRIGVIIDTRHIQPDRAAKRPSRKESHHEDRSRRTDKDGHERTRESDRRRKDRDQSEVDNRPLTIDTKVSEKPIPQGPASASRALPPSTPSAPRAMSSTDATRSSKSDKEWRGREQSQRTSPSGPPASSNQPTESLQSGSLRSRISEKEPSRTTPQAPSSHRKDGALSDGHGDISRKRASSGMFFWSNLQFLDLLFAQSVIMVTQVRPMVIREPHLPNGPKSTVIDGLAKLEGLLTLR
ncbi:hypothetical protein BDY19DRAFT_566952 [Irpex rosettiformis]|uniref:Uncharacterized protein n=1 Tax=Irpex rosettiformis TaxID=378272 RepID=A0ACB8UCK7_9APHY|nr:hypothetical protein BDY19DRAFT_566952 [Irpex rosettiformis]